MTNLVTSYGMNNLPMIGPTNYQDATIIAPVVQSRMRGSLIAPSVPRLNCDNKYMHTNIYSSFPPDEVQLSVVIDFLDYYGWRYVSVLFLNTFYGKKIEGEFAHRAKKRDICIPLKLQISRSSTDKELNDIIRKLNSEPRGKIVVLLTPSYQPIKLLKMAGNENFFWFVNAGWSVEAPRLNDIYLQKNMFLLDLAGMEDHGFTNYFLNLTLKHHNYTWFRNYWSELFQCNAGTEKSYRRTCTGVEQLSRSYLERNLPHSAKAVIESVYIASCALFVVLNECLSSFPKRTFGQCLYYRYRYYQYPIPTNVSKCFGLKDHWGFNKDRFIPRSFKLLHFKQHSSKTIANWNYNPKTEKGVIVSYGDFPQNADILAAVYHSPCKPGQQKILIKSTSGCFSCMDVQSIATDKVPKYLAICGSVLGILLTTAVLCIFVRHRETRVIKATGRELSLMLLLALYLCFISASLYFVKPTLNVCKIKKILLGFGFTACYTPLLMKVIRLYRIVRASKITTLRPSFVSPKSQVIMCAILLALQVFICVFWVLVAPPVIHQKVENYVYVACKFELENLFFSMIPCIALMVACTVLARKTPQLPNNFNEESSIRITMYISCFLWAIFVPLTIYYHKSSRWVTIIVANFTTLIGLVTLLGLFGPRCKMVLLPSRYVTHQTTEWQEENTSFPKRELKENMSAEMIYRGIVETREVATETSYRPCFENCETYALKSYRRASR